MTTNAESRLAEMGIEFPEAPAAVGDYIPVVQFGDMVVTSGQLPMQDGSMTASGKIGADLTVQRRSRGCSRGSVELRGSNSKLCGIDR